jgi:hypothetical protein
MPPMTPELIVVNYICVGGCLAPVWATTSSWRIPHVTACLAGDSPRTNFPLSHFREQKRKLLLIQRARYFSPILNKTRIRRQMLVRLLYVKFWEPIHRFSNCCMRTNGWGFIQTNRAKVNGGISQLFGVNAPEKQEKILSWTGTVSNC